MLHTVNKSQFSSPLLENCLYFIDKGDKVLLLEDGVYGAMAGTSFEKKVTDALKNHEIYAISADIKARGIDKVISGVKVIGYDGFVDLVEANQTNNWM